MLKRERERERKRELYREREREEIKETLRGQPFHEKGRESTRALKKVSLELETNAWKKIKAGRMLLRFSKKGN